MIKSNMLNFSRGVLVTLQATVVALAFMVVVIVLTEVVLPWPLDDSTVELWGFGCYLLPFYLVLYRHLSKSAAGGRHIYAGVFSGVLATNVVGEFAVVPLLRAWGMDTSMTMQDWAYTGITYLLLAAVAYFAYIRGADSVLRVEELHLD